MGKITNFFIKVNKTCGKLATDVIAGLPGNVIGDVVSDILQGFIDKYSDLHTLHSVTKEYEKELDDASLKLLGNVAEACIGKRFENKKKSVTHFFEKLLNFEGSRTIYAPSGLDSFLSDNKAYDKLSYWEKDLVRDTLYELRSRLLDKQFSSLSHDHKMLYNCIAALFDPIAFAKSIAKELGAYSSGSKAMSAIKQNYSFTYIKHECPNCRARLRYNADTHTLHCKHCDSTYSLTLEQSWEKALTAEHFDTTIKNLGGSTRKLVIISTLAIILTVTVLISPLYKLLENEDNNDPTQENGAQTGNGVQTGGGDGSQNSNGSSGGDSQTPGNGVIHDCSTKGHIYTVENKCGVCSDLWEYSEGLEYELVNGSYEVTGIGTCEDTEVVIPYGYEGKPVIGIGEDAFENCTDITAIAIPDSVSNISNCAFYNCSFLKSINIPTSVTRVNSWAFYKCTALSEITIPSTVTSIGERAFYGCSGLTSIIIPNSVTSIGSHAFYNCSNLESITIPFVGATKGGTENTHFGYIFGATTYDSNINYVPSNLKNVIVTNETEIHRYAFYGCVYIYGIDIPNSVTRIEDWAFGVCINLTTVKLGTGITNIGDSAFFGCGKLMEVINKSSLYLSVGSKDNGYIAAYAKEVHDGKSKIINQNGYLFYTYNEVNYLIGYTGKESEITLPEDYDGHNYEIYDYAFYYCSKITSVTIPDGITSIGDSAFGGCLGLTSITIPNSITSIGDSAFSGCGKLMEVINKSSLYLSVGSEDNGYIAAYAKEVHDGESKIINQNGYLFYTYDGTNYLLGYNGTGTDLVLPRYYNGQNYHIYTGAFGFNPKITTVVIPDSVTNIGERAFFFCSSLTNITVSSGNANYKDINGNLYTKDGKTLIQYAIGKLATSFIVPDSVTSIGDLAFSGCLELTSVTIGNSVTSIGDFAFDSCYGLTSVIVGNAVTRIGDSAFMYCYNLTDMKYRGSEAQWTEIYKGQYWAYNTDIYTITYNYTGN